MTKNQIEYWRNVETNRNNLIVEAETKRANQAKEAENLRHNYEMENLTRQTNNELARANYAREQQALLTHYEQQRSNLANEQIRSDQNRISASQVSLGYAQLGLGKAQLGEQITHNRNVEATNLLDAATRSEQQKETVRHNLATERETLMDNMRRDFREQDKLLETIRANQAAEANSRFSSITNLLGSLAGTLGRTIASVTSKPKKEVKIVKKG